MRGGEGGGATFDVITQPARAPLFVLAANATYTKGNRMNAKEKTATMQTAALVPLAHLTIPLAALSAPSLKPTVPATLPFSRTAMTRYSSR